MKNFNYLIILTQIFYCVQVINGDELVELGCSNESQCKQFEHAEIKSTCIGGQCKCITNGGKNVQCLPVEFKVSNIIGGECPCMQPNAECEPTQHICYCERSFIPSVDKRRCILKMVPIGGTCEQHSQCEKADYNAFCHESNVCKCKDQFMFIGGKCVSIVGDKSSVSLNDTDCFKQYGPHAKSGNEYCICVDGYFTSANNSSCLKPVRYLENCTENVQCIATMGTGAECVQNVCQCSSEYFVKEEKTKEERNMFVCSEVVKRGQYCRYEKDCYVQQFNQSEQSMECTYGECNCKPGFSSFNNGDCTKISGADTKYLMAYSTMVPGLILLNIFYSQIVFSS